MYGNVILKSSEVFITYMYRFFNIVIHPALFWQNVKSDISEVTVRVHADIQVMEKVVNMIVQIVRRKSVTQNLAVYHPIYQQTKVVTALKINNNFKHIKNLIDHLFYFS